MKTTRYLSRPPLSPGVRSRAIRLSLLCVLAALILTSAGALLWASGNSYARGCNHHKRQCDGQGQQQQQVVDCKLMVPESPLSAVGLATPYVLAGAGDGNGKPCHENNPNGAAFVQAAVFDPATNQISVYDPLVIDRGTQPAATPTMPQLPQNAVVAVWVGFNGNNLTLVGPGSGTCINGIPGSIFGQNAFCNADAFFQVANAAIQAGKLHLPALGTAMDGKTCPSARDFSLVDQDQSDNTTTQYLVNGNGQTAQDTPQNRAQLHGTQIAFNGSDERVLAIALDKAIGCTPWTAPDLADPTHTQQLTAWPLNELQASTDQAAPIALVPALDPFTLVNNAPNLQKLNAYRAGVDQSPVAQLSDANTTSYCQNLLQVGLPRIAGDQQFTANAPSPFPNMATTLFTFLSLRFHNTFSNQQGFLHCTTLLGVQNPITLVMQNGIVVNATINLNPAPLGNGGPCPLTATAQGQAVTTVCCRPATATVQGQTQIPCCLAATARGQQNTGALCASPTPTDTPSTATPTDSPTLSPGTPTPSATPTEETPTPTVSPTPSPQGYD